MSLRFRSCAFFAGLLAASSALAGPTVTFIKHQLDSRFLSEGVAVADLNGDNEPDIVVSNKHGVFFFIQQRSP